MAKSRQSWNTGQASQNGFIILRAKADSVPLAGKNKLVSNPRQFAYCCQSGRSTSNMALAQPPRLPTALPFGFTARIQQPSPIKVCVRVKHIVRCQTHLRPPFVVCIPVGLDKPVVPALAPRIACAARCRVTTAFTPHNERQRFKRFNVIGPPCVNGGAKPLGARQVSQFLSKHNRCNRRRRKRRVQLAHNLARRIHLYGDSRAGLHNRRQLGRVITKPCRYCPAHKPSE